jgi:hypothetical protein
MEPVQFCTKDHNLKMLTNPILTNKSETATPRISDIPKFWAKRPTKGLISILQHFIKNTHNISLDFNFAVVLQTQHHKRS